MSRARSRMQAQNEIASRRKARIISGFADRPLRDSITSLDGILVLQIKS